MGSNPGIEHIEATGLTKAEYAVLCRLLAAYENDPGILESRRADLLTVSRRPQANPSSLGISVFAVANTLIALHLMQVRSIQHNNLLVGILWFTGGVASWLACILEYLLGNTFAYCVFGSFGGYYFAFAATLTPTFQIRAGYQDMSEFADSMGVFFCVWAALFFVFLIASLRINMIFVWIFALVFATACCLAASYFQVASGYEETGARLSKAAGGLLFSCALGGWYLLVGQLFEGVEMPFTIPVFPLSKRV